jgi:hypothetical protein
VSAVFCALLICDESEDSKSAILLFSAVTSAERLLAAVLEAEFTSERISRNSCSFNSLTAVSLADCSDDKDELREFTVSLSELSAASLVCISACNAS